MKEGQPVPRDPLPPLVDPAGSGTNNRVHQLVVRGRHELHKRRRGTADCSALLGVHRYHARCGSDLGPPGLLHLQRQELLLDFRLWQAPV